MPDKRQRRKKPREQCYLLKTEREKENKVENVQRKNKRIWCTQGMDEGLSVSDASCSQASVSRVFPA